MKRLYSEFKPEHYELSLAPDREKLTFHGRVIISGQKTGRPSQRITLHQKGLRVKSAKLIRHDKKTGADELQLGRVNVHKAYDELRLHAKQLLYPGNYTIEVEFSGRITEPMHGIYPCNFKLNGRPKQLIATQFESHHAREAFPCVDEPEAKATFDLILTTPVGETAIANTPIKRQETKNNRLETAFETTPRMSTYLLAFAYGELGFKGSKTASGTEVRVYATPDKVELTDFALDVGVRSLEFFEQYYGVKYPLPKLDLIGLPDYSAGAMENWGLITFRESVLYVDPKSSTIETKQYVAMVVAHEIAHQWFGNLVTMKWWNDLWLNESFANLMEYRAVDQLFPQWNIWQDFVQREVSSALARDALPNVQPVQVEVNHPSELGALFDPSIVYAKGGSLLNMVRHLIGEDAFRAGLKTYFNEFKYTNTTAADLWRHLEAASGKDIAKIMKNWLEQPGFPVIEVEHTPASGSYTARQRRLVVGAQPPDKSTVWQVPLAASKKSDKPMLGKKTDSFKNETAGNYPLTLNHDGHSYFVSHYANNQHLEQITTAVKKGILSPIDRLLLVQNQLLLERAGLVATLQNIQLLNAYANERDETVWGMLAGIIGNARTLIDKAKDMEKRLNALVRPLAAPLVKELGWDGAKNEPSQTLKLRGLALGLAAGAEDKAVIKEGLRRFEQFNKPSDLAPDVRSVVYFIAVRHGKDAAFNQLLKLYQTLNNAEDKDDIAAELTATRDTTKIKQLLAMITSDYVRLQDAPTWFAWLMRNRYSADLAWQWLNDNWKWVEGKYGDDKSYDRFPRYAAMALSYPAQLKEYKAFFEPKTNIALARPIKLGIEEIASRVAWRDRNEAAVKQWLASQSR